MPCRPIGEDVSACTTGSGSPTNPSDPFSGVNGLAFSPDGKILASADSDGTIRLWDPVTGQPVAILKVVAASAVNGVAFSPDGQILAAAADEGGAGGLIQLWNPATGHAAGAPVRLETSPEPPTALSPDGKLLAVGARDGMIRVWNPAVGRRVPPSLRIGSRAVTALSFSPDSRLIASADQRGVISVWNRSTGKPAFNSFKVSTGTAKALALGPEGRTLAILTSRHKDLYLQLWDVVTSSPVGKPVTVPILPEPGVPPLEIVVPDASAVPDMPRPPAESMAFSPTGKLAILVDGETILWNTSDSAYGGPGLFLPDYHADALAFSPGGRILATADNTGAVHLWNQATGRAVGTSLPIGPLGEVVLAFGDGGEELLSIRNVNYPEILRQWDVALFTAPSAVLCADVGLPTLQVWQQFAPGESEPASC